MIKVRYEAVISLNANLDEDTPGLRPFDTIKALVEGDTLDRLIVSILSGELEDEFSVGLSRICAEVRIHRQEEANP